MLEGVGSEVGSTASELGEAAFVEGASSAVEEGCEASNEVVSTLETEDVGASPVWPGQKWELSALLHSSLALADVADRIKRRGAVDSYRNATHLSLLLRPTQTPGLRERSENAPREEPLRRGGRQGSGRGASDDHGGR